MIITLTLNPAVDKTIYLDDFTKGTVNRVQEVRKDAGGKGINVSKVVAKLGGQTTALGFLGGAPGEFISTTISNFNIKQDFVHLEDETRTNMKIVDKFNCEETEINEPGAEVNAQQLEELEDKVIKTATAEDSVVLTGSLPPGVADDIYADLINKLQAKDIKAFLDASGTALEEGVKASPYLIKPNISELETLVGQELLTVEDMIAAAEKLQEQGIEIVVVSRGGEGSLIVSKEGNFKVTPPDVEPNSTIGAGDTLVGALALKLEAGVSLKEALEYATAASANSVTKAGTQLCKANEVEELLEEVEITEL